MPSPTAGFQLTALPRAPDFPSNLGVFDPLGVSRNFRAGATLMPTVAAEQAQAEAAVPEAQLAGQQARLKSSVLAETGPTDVRTAVLRAKVGETTAENETKHQERVQQLRQKAIDENAAGGLTGEFETARKLPTASERASSLAGLKFKYSWLNAVPEYANVLGNIDKAAAAAELQAQEEIKVGGAQNVAELKAANAKEIADIKAAAVQTANEMKMAVEQLKLQAAQEKLAQSQQYGKELAELRGQIQQGNTDVKIRTEGAYKDNQELVVKGRDSQPAIRKIDGALKLFDEGLRTGFGAEAVAKVKRIGQALGADFGKDVSNFEQLQPVIGAQVLSFVQQTKGSISNKEMEIFENYAASNNKTPAGNKAILGAVRKALERDVAIAKMVNDLRKEGKSEIQIQQDVNSYVLDNPIITPEELAAPDSTPTDEAKPDFSSMSTEALGKRVAELRAKKAKK